MALRALAGRASTADAAKPSRIMRAKNGERVQHRFDLILGEAQLGTGEPPQDLAIRAGAIAAIDRPPLDSAGARRMGVDVVGGHLGIAAGPEALKAQTDIVGSIMPSPPPFNAADTPRRQSGR